MANLRFFKQNTAPTDTNVGDVWFNPDENLIYINKGKEINSNGHAYVDLGLPSGTLWATMNIGASSETDSGLYFAWADTVGYENATSGKNFTPNDAVYNISSYPYYSKYNKKDNIVSLDLEDDAASVNWGGDWHIPTKEQVLELRNESNVSYSPKRNYLNSGVNGTLITSKINGNSIFFPWKGYCYDKQIINSEQGYYITNYMCDPNLGIYTFLLDFGFMTSGNSLSRYQGSLIRPVID